MNPWSRFRGLSYLPPRHEESAPIPSAWIVWALRQIK